MAIEDKIIHGLERLSEVFKTLLLDKAKTYQISPIQIQILLFIHNHSQHMSNVTYLSKEFNITKATISDAIKSLHSKGYLSKDFSSIDNRSYTLFLTAKGKDFIKNINDYYQPLLNILQHNEIDNLDSFYTIISNLIFGLHQKGIIQVQRTCYACKFYSQKESKYFCNLLNQTLENTEIKLDCPDFKKKEKET